MDEVVSWVELCGVTFAGAEWPDAGLAWSDLTGWWGLPDARGSGDQIPGAHGRFVRAEVWRDARVLALSGFIYADDNAGLVEARTRLESALAVGAGVMKVATAASGVWERYVEIDSLSVDPDHGRRWTKFTVDMVAPDPRRYGPVVRVGPASLPVSTGGVRFPQSTPFNFGSVSAGSRLVIPNGGAIAVLPSMVVEGGFESVTVSDVTAGRRLRLEWPVGEGEVAVFDSRVRRVEVAGVEVTRYLTRREWFSVPPGETHEFRFEVVGVAGAPLLWGEYREGAW